MTRAPRRGGSASFRTARRRRCSAWSTSAAPTTTCSCRSTRTCTRWVRARIPTHVLARSRDRWAPISCTRIAAATSPITGRASSSATRSCRSPSGAAGQRDVVAYVRRLEGVLIDDARHVRHRGAASRGLHRRVGRRREDRRDRRAGRRGRTRHGFALNVDPDLAMFDHIVPCGISDRGVTSMARLLGRAPEMHEVVDRVVERFAAAFGHPVIERQDVALARGRRRPRAVHRAADTNAGVPGPAPEPAGRQRACETRSTLRPGAPSG